jgi:hypothetical protein
MAAESAGMRASEPSTAASSARVHQCVAALPSSATSQGTQPSLPARTRERSQHSITLHARCMHAQLEGSCMKP